MVSLRQPTTPYEFKCPITLEIMADPVVAEDGNSYERASILTHFANKRTSPLTNDRIGNKVLPNHNLRKRIEDWQQQKSTTQQSLGQLQGRLFDATTSEAARSIVDQIHVIVTAAHVDQALVSKLEKLQTGVAEEVLDDPLRQQLGALVLVAKETMARAVALAQKQKEEADARERIYEANKKTTSEALAMAEAEDAAAAAGLARAQATKEASGEKVEALRQRLRALQDDYRRACGLETLSEEESAVAEKKREQELIEEGRRLVVKSSFVHSWWFFLLVAAVSFFIGVRAAFSDGTLVARYLPSTVVITSVSGETAAATPRSYFETGVDRSAIVRVPEDCKTLKEAERGCTGTMG